MILDIVIKVAVLCQIVSDAGLPILAVPIFCQDECVTRHIYGRVSNLRALSKFVLDISFLIVTVKILVDLKCKVFAFLFSLPDIGGGS